MIVMSGLGGTVAQAQEQVAVGMGTLAGSTIMLLSIAWGGSLIVGRCDLESGVAVNRYEYVYICVCVCGYIHAGSSHACTV